MRIEDQLGPTQPYAARVRSAGSDGGCLPGWDLILRWVLLALVLVLAALQYRLWVGEGSLGEITVLRREIREQHLELERLRERNRACRPRWRT